MVILVKLLQPQNAESPIVSTGRSCIRLGIFTVEAFSVYLVMVTLPSTMLYSRPAGKG